MVTICVTIVHTYVQLNYEDHRWQWPAFFSGGSVAVYVLLYACYYYYAKTAMSGMLQFAFYYSYMTALRCVCVWMCACRCAANLPRAVGGCGTVGGWTS
jgi:hypothetical protein